MIATSTTSRPFVDRWLVLIVACLGAYVVASNTTAVMTALPEIRAELDLGTLATQWVVNLYMLCSAVLVAIMGRFSDIFGKLNVFVLGLCVFAAGSIAILIADDIIPLMIGRVAQGVGAAALMGASIALVDVTTEKSKRALALGIWAGLVAFGLGAGPLIAGALIEAISWRAVFAIDVVFLAIAAVLCWRIARLELVPPAERSTKPVDYLGTGLLIVTLAPFVYGLSDAHVAGWASVQTLGLFAISIAGAAVFVIRERGAVEPLVYFRFFRHPWYLASTLGIFVNGFALLSVLYFFNLYAQSAGGLGFTAFAAGAAILPYAVTCFLLSITLPRVLSKTTMRWPITIGMLLIAAGLWLLSRTTAEMTYGDLWWRLIFVGAGMGLTYPLFPIVGLRALPDEHAGQGSGVINMCFYMGLSVALAAGGTVLGKIRQEAVATTITGLSDAPANALQWVRDLAHGSGSQLKQALAHFSAADGSQIEHTLRTVGASAFSSVMTLFMILALIGAATSFWLIRPHPDEVVAPHPGKQG
ncbi:MAG: MFS transporter [Hyphomicrobium sp.]